MYRSPSPSRDNKTRKNRSTLSRVSTGSPTNSISSRSTTSNRPSKKTPPIRSPPTKTPTSKTPAHSRRKTSASPALVKSAGSRLTPHSNNSRNRKRRSIGGFRSPAPLPQSLSFSPPTLSIVVLTRMSKFEQSLRAALEDVPDLHITALNGRSNLSEQQQRALSTARVIMADPDLLSPVLGKADSVEWVQSLSPDICDIVDAIQRIQVEREEMMRELEAKMTKVREADRVLEEANEKVRAMKKRDLTELCHYVKPPPRVKLCLTATCDLLGFGEKLEYDMLKKLLVKENFPRTMSNFDPTTVTAEKLDRLDALYLSLPEFTVKHMKNASLVCGILTNWLLSLRMVCKFCQDAGVQELKKELADLQSVNPGCDDASLDNSHFVNESEVSDNFILTKIGDCFGDMVAEYCLMQILNWSRHAHEMKSWQSKKKWCGQVNSTPKKVLNFSTLKEHVVGILGGSGNIGIAVGNLLHCVGCKVHGLVNKERTDLPEEKVTWFAADKDELLSFLQSGLSVLISCLPSTHDTAGFLSRDLLDKAYGSESSCSPPLFINIGSSNVIYSSDLIAVLEQGLFSGAALDVFEDEPLPVDNPLWAYNEWGRGNENSLIITPHVAGLSESVLPQIVALCKKNLLAFTADKGQLSFVVDVARGY